MEGVLKDERFSLIAKDPRFRKMKRENRKVKIDDRFKDMFKDKKFKVKYMVDKRGRPVNTSTAENLKKYYDVSSEDTGSDSEDTDSATDDDDVLASGDESDDGEMPEHKIRSKVGKTTAETGDDKEGEREKQEEEESDGVPESEIKMDSGLDYARGEALMESSSESSSDEESESDSSQESDIEHDWGEIDKEAPAAEEVTSRLALCNMDWDRLSAKDLLVMLNSFKPVGGVIKSVKVYPSEFGLQRMKEEKLKGPIELVNLKKKHKNSRAGDDNEEGSEYHREKLRQYQFKRLKYYYAVVECDSVDTASHLYSQCDGLEYETSSSRLDLRFIPNGMTFEQEPKSVATDMPDVTTYKPMVFINSALQQTTVECTWDEDDQKRARVTRRKLKPDDIEDLDLQDYLASDSDAEEDPYGNLEEPSFEGGNSESEDEESAVEKYRKLMASVSEKETKSSQEDTGMEMEITWEPGIKEHAEKLVTKRGDKEELTPWDKYLKKKKEKKKERKAERKKEKEKDKQRDDDSGDSDGNDRLSSDDDLPSDIDLNDPYFKEALDEIEGKTQHSESKTKGHKKKTKENKKKTKEHKKNTKDSTAKDESKKQNEQAELGLLMMDDDDNKQHFSLDKLLVPTHESKTKKKKRLKQEAEAKAEGREAADTFKLDIDDPRFKAVYENPLYNIDPSAPQFKKTKNMDLLVEEKVKRSGKKRKAQSDGSEAPVVKQKDKTDHIPLQAPKEQSIDSLIKSVKSKAQNLEAKKKKKLQILR